MIFNEDNKRRKEMWLYRVKQFYWSLTSKIGTEDKLFINYYLQRHEAELFSKLSISEQKHCIKVAMDVKECCDSEKINLNEKIFIKIALLHDIGKLNGNLGVVDKSLIVILNKITKGKIKKLHKIKKIDVYYNHGNKGYDLLKKYNYDERFLFLIKNHHNSAIIGDKELDILMKCDNRN